MMEIREINKGDLRKEGSQSSISVRSLPTPKGHQQASTRSALALHTGFPQLPIQPHTPFIRRSYARPNTRSYAMFQETSRSADQAGVRKVMPSLTEQKPIRPEIHWFFRTVMCPAMWSRMEDEVCKFKKSVRVTLTA